MLSEQDRMMIQDTARRYGVGRVLLFGSSAEHKTLTHDIDIAVEGLAPSRFFSFYGDLIFGLSKSVDVVDLDRRSKFTDMIRRDGVPLYG